MRKILIAAAVTLLTGSAFAQGTGPQPQNDMTNKPGMTNSNSGMDKGATSNTTGMSKDKNSMKKDGMKNDSMSKDGMKKDGMSK